MLNQSMLIGNLGRDPQMSLTPGSQAVTKYSLAVSRRWNDKASGERREETTWFNCLAWGQLAENCNQHLRKGSKVFVEGRMTSHKYTDRNNIERVAWDCVLSQMEMLSGARHRPCGVGASGRTPTQEEERRRERLRAHSFLRQQEGRGVGEGAGDRHARQGDLSGNARL